MLNRHRSKNTAWEWEIKPNTSWLGTSFKELIAYKDLVFRLVRKEFLSYYQQTLLGPLWVLLKPLLTVLTYVLIFKKVIGLSTDGVPAFLFYLAGITLWNLFSELFVFTAETFKNNLPVFSKVYFPRIIVPVSILLLRLLIFGIHLALLIVVLFFYNITQHISLDFSHLLIALPAIFITAGLSFGGGLVFAVLTAKYKDLFSVLQLIISLLMFVCPIFYSLNMVPQKVKWIVRLNPLSSVFEMFRYAFFGRAEFNTAQLMYSFSFMTLIVIAGVLLFNKMCDKLIDVA